MAVRAASNPTPPPSAPSACGQERTARAAAALVRRRARAVLNGLGGRGNRLTLVLASLVLLTVAVGIYSLSAGGYTIAFLLLGDSPWPDMIAYALLGVLGVTVGLPLMASVFRLACLMTLRAYPGSVSHDLPVTQDVPEPVAIFYPFTSLRAYGRSLAIGLEALGWTVLWAGIPLGGFRLLCLLFDYLALQGVSALLCDLMTLAVFPLCLGFGGLMLFLSGRRAGFGFLAFVHEDLSLGEINRYFHGFKRGFVRPFILRMSMVGWIALSILAVLVPFVLHTIPYGLCCGAVYGAELEQRSDPKIHHTREL